MKQGYLTVVEYEKEFSRLSKYAPELVLIETFRCRQFEDGLKESIKKYLTVVTSLQVVNFCQLVQVAMKIKKSKMKNPERNRERKFSRGGSSSGKRTRESQVDSVLQEVGDKVLLCHRVTVESFQPNKTKDLNACTTTNTMLVFADG